MRHYVLNICQPDSGPRPGLDMTGVQAALNELNHEMAEAGAFVFTDACLPPETAVVIAPDGTMTAGSYWSGDTHVGGFWIVRADDDASAQAWARKATACLGLPIEVRGLATPVES